MNTIYKSNLADWIMNENMGYLKMHPEIKITWTDFKDQIPLHDKWATDFWDERAYLLQLFYTRKRH